MRYKGIVVFPFFYRLAEIPEGNPVVLELVACLNLPICYLPTTCHLVTTEVPFLHVSSHRRGSRTGR